MKYFFVILILLGIVHTAYSNDSSVDSQQGRAVKQLDSAEPFQAFTCALPLEAEPQAAKLKIYYQKNLNQTQAG